MAIRARIIKAPTKGYPDMVFQGYVLRFGHVQACFYSPGMEMLMGRYERSKGPHRPAAIYFYFHHGLINEIDRRKANNLLWEELQAVIDYWPNDLEAESLRSFSFPSMLDE